MAQLLIENGRIDGDAWAHALNAAIQKRLNDGQADDLETYFGAVSDALERLLAMRDGEIGDMVEAWRQAYLTTPHGKPVRLARRDG